jgi:hypothetical protein
MIPFLLDAQVRLRPQGEHASLAEPNELLHQQASLAAGRTV